MNTREPRIIIRHNHTDEVLLRLNGETLRGIDLSGANLAGAAMYAIELVGTQKSDSPVFDVNRRVVDLAGAKLSKANLSGAVFSESMIVGTDFSNANLAGAVLVRSHLIRTNLKGANLSGARLMNTSFSECPTLCKAAGLEELEHSGPSTLDSRTLRSCVKALPDAFMLGAGYTMEEIERLQAMYCDPKPFYSCFISYSRQDSEFAEWLRSELIKNDISCWQDTHDMRGGDYWRRQIYDAIEKQDKMILVCSRNALDRPAVVEEIIEAIDRERATKSQKLFPVRIDDYILSAQLEETAKVKVSSGEWRDNWVSYVRAYHIPDFSSWKNKRKIAGEWRRLLKALRHPEGR